MVWERLNVPPISSILPKDDVATWQKILWGIVPFLTVLIAFIINIQSLFIRGLKMKQKAMPVYLNIKNNYTKFSNSVLKSLHIWAVVLSFILFYGVYQFYIKNETQISPENAIIAYYDAIDFKEFEKGYQLIDPECNLPISQYMLEVSVTDGLLSSYAKLDAITTETITKTDS
jgi:hypothetical protein